MNNDINKRDEHPFFIWESIIKSPEILEDCLMQDVSRQVEKVAERLIEKQINRMFLLGTAASYFASMAERFTFEKLTKIPTQAFLTSEFKAYPPLELNSKSAVFMHSHSGRTAGDIEVVKFVKDRGAYAVGVTDIKESALANCVDDVIIGPGEKKLELPATRTYTSAVFRMIQLAVKMGKELSPQEEINQYEIVLQKIPQLLASLIQKCELEFPKSIETLLDCKSFFVIGSGPNYATAHEAAIGFSQSMGVPAQSFQLQNFLHGPIHALRSHMGVVLIAADGPFQKKMLSAARACNVIGAKVILLLPENVDPPDEIDLVIKLPSGIPETLSPLITISPLWQLAYQFAILGRGCHPDRLSMDRPEFKEAFDIIKKG